MESTRYDITMPSAMTKEQVKEKLKKIRTTSAKNNVNYELNYEGFEDYLLYCLSVMDGVQYIFLFPNYYGASVVKYSFSYGCKGDLWEIAPVKFDKSLGMELVGDVEGYLTDKQIRDRLQDIKEWEVVTEWRYESK